MGAGSSVGRDWHGSLLLHGLAETIGAFHRKLRESAITQKELAELLAEFDTESKAGAFTWLTAFAERD